MGKSHSAVLYLQLHQQWGNKKNPILVWTLVSSMGDTQTNWCLCYFHLQVKADMPKCSSVVLPPQRKIMFYSAFLLNVLIYHIQSVFFYMEEQAVMQALIWSGSAQPQIYHHSETETLSLKPTEFNNFCPVNHAQNCNLSIWYLWTLPNQCELDIPKKQ